MMKRIFALLLCAALCLSLCSAMAETAMYVTQPEKIARQYVSGSGVKGSIVFHAEGDAEWAKQVASISDVELQLRAMDVVNSGYQARLYVSQDGDTLAMTELYSDGGNTAWLTSDFLMGSTYAFPAAQNMLTDVTSIGRENPTWYTVPLNMLLKVSEESWKEKWLPELDAANQLMELWLAPYAAAPERLNVNGTTRMLVRYEIPVSAVKKQMKALLPVLLGNQRLMKDLNGMMTENQATIYLHQGYTWYYNQLIDDLKLDGNVVLERQFSTMGEDYSTLMTFPVLDNKSGLKEVTVMQEEGNTTFSMIFDTKTVLVTAQSDNHGMVMGTVRVYDEQNGNISLGYELNSAVEKHTDDKEREHETYTWVLNAQPELSFLADNDPARSAYQEFDPFMVEVSAHFYSKSGSNSAVTLELNADVTSLGSKAGVEAVIKTASQWHLPEAYVGQTVRLDKMTDEQRAELWNDWLNNGMMAIAALRPVEEATVEEVPVVTETPDAATATDITEE